VLATGVHNGLVSERPPGGGSGPPPRWSAETDLDRLAVESIVAELDTAHEELRVAEEELQAQQEEVHHLLGYHQSARWWQEQLIANLPVPVVITDRVGKVKSTNAAGSRLLGLREVDLLRKPLQTFIGRQDRQAVRRALSETLSEGRGRSLGCELQPRDAPAQRVDLVVSPGPDASPDEPRLTWIALPDHSPAPTGPQDATLAEALCRLARVAAQSEQTQNLREVAQICAQVIAPAAAVSVTVGPPAEPSTLASDRKLAQDMDALQMRADEGPCQEAWERCQVVVTNRLDDDPRWPELARLAAPDRVASVLAVPVLVGDEPVGVINAYATAPNLFVDLDVRTAELLASAVGAVIQQVEERERLTNLANQLQEALTSRAAIDQAKGIIMARYGCDPDQAFQRLVRVSRSQNIKLRDVARVLVERAQRGNGDNRPPRR
jgi:PAS domain S-box-containing protein